MNAVTAIVCQCLPAAKLMCDLQADMMATSNIQLLLLLLLHQAQVHCHCLVQCWHYVPLDLESLIALMSVHLVQCHRDGL